MGIRAAVAGATGYTGAELLRLLGGHDDVEVVRATSETYAGQAVGEVFGSLRALGPLRLESLDPATLARDVDVVFTALPHATAAEVVAASLQAGARVIDLSADFRLRSQEVYEKWYGPHPHPDLIERAVYGVPEFYRDEIRCAQLVANPGCYPMAALFGTVPLARAGLVARGPIIVDAMSGVSGAGRGAKTALLFGEVAENLRPYGLDGHRHQPEIEQEIARAGGPSEVIFTPHLVPIRRGILATIHVAITAGLESVTEAFEQAFADEPFVELLGESGAPEVRDLRGTNRVALGWNVTRPGYVRVTSAIDNLGRGASAQAVQNLNLMFGFDEARGIPRFAAFP